MKLHTSLGISPRKKLALGAAALTLISSVSPLSINSVYANSEQQKANRVLYTLVGPDYYTLVPDTDNMPDSLTLQVADTSIADFYTNTGECSGRYTCLQGKKIGETEVIVKNDGEEFGRIPLISAEMTPEAITVKVMGGVANVTGSLNGADSELLNLEHVSTDEPIDGIIVEQTGPRSFMVDTTAVSSFPYATIHASWSIGMQPVSGGTIYDFEKISAEDKINGSKETEDILVNTWLNLAKKYFMNNDELIGPYADVIVSDGSIFRSIPAKTLGMPKYTTVVLDRKEASISKTEEKKHLEKLPENINNVSFDNISVEEYMYFDRSGNAAMFSNQSAATLSFPSASSTYQDDDYDGYVKTGDFLKLGTAINVTLDASDTPAVKDGYTRKYYVTVTKNDGSVEVVDAEYNAEDKNFTFAISEFGNIAYGYVDEKIKEEPAGESVVPKVPNTGSPIQKVAQTAAITFAPLAAIVFGAFMVRNKKKASSKLAKKHEHFE